MLLHSNLFHTIKNKIIDKIIDMSSMAVFLDLGGVNTALDSNVAIMQVPIKSVVP